MPSVIAYSLQTHIIQSSRRSGYGLKQKTDELKTSGMLAHDHDHGLSLPDSSHTDDQSPYRTPTSAGCHQDLLRRAYLYLLGFVGICEPQGLSNLMTLVSYLAKLLVRKV